MTFRPCAIVPSYNHHANLPNVIAGLRAIGLSVLVVDDGSAEPARAAIAANHDPENGVRVHRLSTNQGKGAAVVAGFRLAWDQGFTHALQADADGQHDIGAASRLIDLARARPEALVSGKPIYDDTAPKSRTIGRWMTHVWVWVETLSLRITDSMCGFRVYPLRAALDVVEREPVGTRMDFDTDIMVRMAWRGVPVIMTPVAVAYPKDNLSNFDLWRDNWRITKMHTRLVFTMIARMRSVIRNRQAGDPQTGTSHWAELQERGASWGLSFLAGVYRLFGRSACAFAMQPIILYFFLTGHRQRRWAAAYWRRVLGAEGSEPVVGWGRLFRHFRAFGDMALDKFAVWMGDITVSDLVLSDEPEIDRLVAEKRGIVVIASHLGNIEVSRALSRHKHGVEINILTHTRNAFRFNRLITRINPDAAVRVVEVADLSPSHAIDLQSRLEKGEWIVITGDRVPLSGNFRTSRIPFFGDPAPFPHGPIILASLLKCPVYTMQCLKDGRKYRVTFEKLFESVTLSRGNRIGDIDACLSVYVARLQHHCQAYPYQWFNFYDFWQEDAAP